MSLTFEWDRRKARANFRKHVVALEEASTVFGGPLSITIHDPRHSHNEERYATMGMTVRRRMVVVVHTDRQDKVRIISARVATPRERKVYEEAN